MKKILDKQKLILQYKPGFGSWTYHLVIPDSAKIKGMWGSMKVIGKIDDFIIPELNLAPRQNADKIISINKEIRKAIKKDAGDTVIVTLFLLERLDGKREIAEALSLDL